MIKEFDVVVLTHDLLEHGLVKGSQGAVVHTHKTGEDFEVEFIEPPHVLTLNVADIKLDKNIIQAQVAQLMNTLPEEAIIEVRDFAEALSHKHLSKVS
ncbi:MAG: DUF4926 domain-containing protein [Cyanobacteria bacterium J06649_4]